MGSQLLSGVWYTIEILGLGVGGTQLSLSINGEAVSISNLRFPAIIFSNFNGPLYIGGHPSLPSIRVSNLANKCLKQVWTWHHLPGTAYLVWIIIIIIVLYYSWLGSTTPTQDRCLYWIHTQQVSSITSPGWRHFQQYRCNIWLSC